MDTVKPGYHFIESKALTQTKFKTFKEYLSIIEFLKRIRGRSKLPQDSLVLGLAQLLYSTENRIKLCKFIKDLLADRVNFLSRSGLCIVFVIEGSLEQWQHPIVRYHDTDLTLHRIFGTLERIDINHFYAPHNITS